MHRKTIPKMCKVKGLQIAASLCAEREIQVRRFDTTFPNIPCYLCTHKAIHLRLSMSPSYGEEEPQTDNTAIPEKSRR
jgi:hypothetical protein